MAFTTYYGPNTIVSETCLWVADGHRRICITYTYNVSNGILTYAASVYRCEVTEYDQHTIGVSEPTHEQMLDHVHTTTRRFEIRPVIILVATKLTYDQILKTIRREMCHGYGCKGPRMLASAFDMDCGASDGGSVSSANTWLSESTPIRLTDFRAARYPHSRPNWNTMCTNGDIAPGSMVTMSYHGVTYGCVVSDNGSVVDRDMGQVYSNLTQWAKSHRNGHAPNVFDVCNISQDEDAIDVDYETDRDEWTEDDWSNHLGNIHKIQRKTLRKLRYFSAGKVENYKGERVRVMREFFITFKADKKTGALIYGAAISRRPEELGPITDKDLIDEHFKTAAARLEYRPVTMFISEEFRDQLRSKPVHREDVMYEILDVILSRPGGKFLIREDW
jgi:hypothetical protein